MASRTSRDSLPVLLVDGDDTLWETEPLYDRARERAALIVASQGIDPLRWTALQLEIDLDNVSRFGLSAERFPTSSVEAYEQASREVRRAPDPTTAAAIREAAASVFTTPAPVFTGAQDALSRLQPHFRIVLLTKGDRVVQQRRIVDSGLQYMFDEVRIVEAKDASTVKQVLVDLGAEASESWSVGNSIPSDVKPAIEAGLRAVWIDRHVWAHERHHEPIVHSRLAIADDLIDLPNIILAGISHAGTA